MTAPAMDIPRSGISRRLRSLADMRGIWSLGDQAILSLGNFLTTWLLLRTHSLWYADYFTIVLSIYFLNNLHMALVTYPISITSAGITDSELRRRIRRAGAMTLLLLVPESIAIAAITTFTTHDWHLVPWAIAALAFWQLQETSRRALMARLEHRRAIVGDVISYLGQAAAVWFCIHRGSISIVIAFAIIALTSGLALLIQAVQLQLHLPSNCQPMHTARQQARLHFSLGQWILLSNIVNLLTIYAVPWTLRFARGKEEVLAYSAVLLVLNASNPLLSAVANLITPVVAKAKADAQAIGQTGARQTQRLALKYAVQGALLLFPFFLFLILFPGVALHFFYKVGSPYLTLTAPMRIFAFAFAATYVSAMFNSYLCGLGKSRAPFLGQLANAGITCVITLPLVLRFGLIGAAWGAIFPVMAQLLIGAWHTWKVQLTVADTVSPYTDGFPLSE